MSRLLAFLGLGPLLIVLSSAWAFALGVVDRAAAAWSIAFPNPDPLRRSVGDWPAREDAKPVARRFREYRDRVMARTAIAPAPRLIAAA